MSDRIRPSDLPYKGDRPMGVGFCKNNNGDLLWDNGASISATGVAPNEFVLPDSAVYVANNDYNSGYGEYSGALSTSTAKEFAAPVLTKRVRITWMNNGATGGTTVGIAVGCSNERWGFAIATDAAFRDAQLTIGNSIVLETTGDDFIGILHIVPSVAITSGTHLISIDWRA